MHTYTRDLRKFLGSPLPNTWIMYENLSVYVRKGWHGINGRFMHTLDVANVCVDTPVRGQGIFSQWLEVAEAEAKQHGLDAIYVENLLNLRLADWLARRGYMQTGQPELPSFYLI